MYRNIWWHAKAYNIKENKTITMWDHTCIWATLHLGASSWAGEVVGHRWIKLHPFLHAFSGKDNTVFIYDIGETRILKIRHQLNLKALALYGYDDNYKVKSEIFESALRAHLFISGGKSKDLSGLPPTADAFKQHLMRSLLATHTQKHAYVAVPPATTFGWKMGAMHLEPVSMTVWPLLKLTL